jgi:hypothetical protein
MIQTIGLTSAQIHEADALRTIDDKCGRPSDVERCQPQPMIDAVALDHRALGIDEDGEGKIMSGSVTGHLLGALTDDHQHLGSECMICREMRLQLLQLPAAVRSPGAANEHQDGSPATEDIRQSNLLAVASPQHEWRRCLTDAEACILPCHLSSLVTAMR